MLSNQILPSVNTIATDGQEFKFSTTKGSLRTLDIEVSSDKGLFLKWEEQLKKSNITIGPGVQFWGFTHGVLVNKDVEIGACVVIRDGSILSAGCKIGPGTSIGFYCRIGKGTTIGKDVTIEVGSVIYDRKVIPDGVTVKTFWIPRYFLGVDMGRGGMLKRTRFIDKVTWGFDSFGLPYHSIDNLALEEIGKFPLNFEILIKHYSDK